MPETCSRCGRKLGLSERFGDEFCRECEESLAEQRRNEQRAAEQRAAEAREELQAVAEQLSDGALSATDAATALQEITKRGGLSGEERAQANRLVVERLVSRVLADDLWSDSEERAFDAALSALGISYQGAEAMMPGLMNRLLIARVNDGRLTTVPSPQLMVKRGEVVHYEVPASLLKEVTMREYQGGYAGLSFRVAKGIRFNTGGVRGKSVIVGTELKVEDEGVLSMSSKRAVFLGSRKTVELPYSKLVNLHVFQDGIRFHQSNRQKAPIFLVPNGEVVAAVVNAAFQRYE